MKAKNLIITLLALLTSIGASAAYQWTDANGTTWSFTTSEGNATLYSGSNQSRCISGTIPANLTVPSTVYIENTPYTVTSIGHSAFYQCTTLTSVTIPNSVTSIGMRSFYGCTRLTSISIPNSVTIINNNAFYYNTALTSITIPNSVTTIGDDVFTFCSSLTSITILNSATSIGIRAFSKCSNLSSVTLGNSVTSIGDYAFIDCSNLTSITIPNSVTSIGKGAFMRCTSLTSFSIPESVTVLGESMFVECTSLTSVTVEYETPPSIPNTFGSINRQATLYVPYGCWKAYRSAENWMYFSHIDELPNPNAITVGSTGYATFCSPKAMDFTDVDGIKAYIASGFNPTSGTLVLTRVTEVPAGEGLYIVGTPGTYNVPKTTTDMIYSNLLKGVTAATTIYSTDGDYTNFILANGSHGIGFYTLSSAGELAAGKAYLQLPTASVAGVKAFSFTFDDGEATGISEVKNVPSIEGIYNLQGQRISQPRKGLNIINGKKVIIK